MPRSSTLRIDRDVPTFSVVDAVTPVGTAPCAECRGPIVDAYYEADQGVICVACQAGRIALERQGTAEGHFGRAVSFGVLAAIAAAAGYIALLAATGRELTLAVLLIGLVVGKAVRIGSRGRGGRRFQWLAVALTCLAIAATYVPFVVKGYSRSSSLVDSAAGAASVAAPALEGANHMVAALLMLAALVYAWRLNRRVDVAITGTYRVQARSI